MTQNIPLDYSRFEVLTFDCFGTLIDWERGILDALAAFRSASNIDATDDELLEQYAWIESTIERGPYRPYRLVLRDAMRTLAALHGVEDFDENAIVDAFPGWPAFPDTRVALEALARRYKLAIISNVDDDLFAETQQTLGVAFDWIVTAKQAGAYKPSRVVFEKAFEVIGMPKDRILHCAQSRFHDIAPARALGIETVWVNRRHGRGGEGATAHSDALPSVAVPDLAALARLVGA